MKKILFVGAAALLVWGCAQTLGVSKEAPRFPSFNEKFAPPPGTKDVFQLSQAYPDTFQAEKYPWLAVDFKTDWKGYMQKVFDYCMEGNYEVDFKGQDNAVRKWYHAPWQHWDSIAGREWHHGLTRELSTAPFGMTAQQTDYLENWAVGLYNAPGGYTFGKVWKDSIPNTEHANFPEGTVSFKLLFSSADAKQVGYLRGTKVWDANIFVHPTTKTFDTNHRQDAKVHLMQMDVAIKDNRAPTGWLLGTFIYDGSKGNADWRKNMVPVGLSWGNDPDNMNMMNQDGAFENASLKEGFINTALIKDTMGRGVTLKDTAYVTHFGIGGRANGPIDNRVSGCMSCHAQAAITDSGFAASLGYFNNKTAAQYPEWAFREYFRNVPCGNQTFTDTISLKGGGYRLATFRRTDFSLQLTGGISQFWRARIMAATPAPESAKGRLRTQAVKAAEVELPRVTRGE